MIFIEKTFQIPNYLKVNQAKWEKSFFADYLSGKSKRPHSYQYSGNSSNGYEIKTQIYKDSHKKCYYCEKWLSFAEAKVEHYIEIADDYTQALKWENLYISCEECNNAKKGKTKKELEECLDPCNPWVEPLNNLVFSKYRIFPAGGSAIGQKTIETFGLDRVNLNLSRADALLAFCDQLEKIRKKLTSNGNTGMSQQDKNILKIFCQDQYEFSLMFKILFSVDFPELLAP
jgi:uncharacterized protein (TIGR02646 family)